MRTTSLSPSRKTNKTRTNRWISMRPNRWTSKTNRRKSQAPIVPEGSLANDQLSNCKLGPLSPMMKNPTNQLLKVENAVRKKLLRVRMMMNTPGSILRERRASLGMLRRAISEMRWRDHEESLEDEVLMHQSLERLRRNISTLMKSSKDQIGSEITEGQNLSHPNLTTSWRLSTLVGEWVSRTSRIGTRRMHRFGRRVSIRGRNMLLTL